MSFLVTCTVDLKNASATDYQNAYADLARIGRAWATCEGPTTLNIPPTHMLAPQSAPRFMCSFKGNRSNYRKLRTVAMR